MKFSLGDAVRIIPLKKNGTITELQYPLYKVTVGSITVTCKESDLQHQKKGKKRAVPKGTHSSAAKKARSNKTPELDLHGQTVNQALDSASHFISRTILSGYSSADIVHGRGTGKLMQALHEYFRGESAIKRFELSKANPGVTKVYFVDLN